MTSRLATGLVLALALVVAGCAETTVSKQPDKQADKQPDDGFVLGQTTRQEILRRLGSPYREGTVTKNGKQLKTLTYAFGIGGTPNRPGINAARGQGFYFLDDKLAGYDFASSWKEDQTDFDAGKVPGIKKGISTRDDVQRLLGRPGGRYGYPLIPNQSGQADVYLYYETRGTSNNVKLYQKLLVVTYDDRKVVSDVNYQETGRK